MLKDLMLDGFINNKEYNCFLAQTSDLKHFHKDIAKLLKYYYSRTGFESRAASLINALFCQNLQTFMFCRQSMAKLYAQDALSPYKTLNNRDYGMFLSTILNSPDFEVLREPTGSKAGVYKLIKPALVALLHQNCSQKYFEAQEKFTTAYFDTDGDVCPNTEKGKKKKLNLISTSLVSKEEKIESIKKLIRKQVENTKEIK